MKCKLILQWQSTHSKTYSLGLPSCLLYLNTLFCLKIETTVKEPVSSIFISCSEYTSLSLWPLTSSYFNQLFFFSQNAYDRERCERSYSWVKTILIFQFSEFWGGVKTIFVVMECFRLRKSALESLDGRIKLANHCLAKCICDSRQYLITVFILQRQFYVGGSKETLHKVKFLSIKK